MAELNNSKCAGLFNRRSKLKTPCHSCGHSFDQDWLGRYGCPNCHGEGLETKPEPDRNKMKVEIRKQKSNGKIVVYLVQGDLRVNKGLFTSKAKATKEAKRIADLYGCPVA